MAVIPAVTCPNCEKKFKPKGEVAGKKIKCPFCKEPFAVPAAKEEKGHKSAKGKDRNGKGKEEDAIAAGPPPGAVDTAVKAEAPKENLDADDNPYGVGNQDLRKRCPNCANEMQSQNAIICLFCGYNTLTREVGKAQIVKALTFKVHLIYLLPPIGAAAFTFFLIMFQIWFATVGPLYLSGWLAFLDSESMRMWSTVIFLGWIWAAGMFCFKKFFENPKPEEVSTSA